MFLQTFFTETHVTGDIFRQVASFIYWYRNGCNNILLKRKAQMFCSLKVQNTQIIWFLKVKNKTKGACSYEIPGFGVVSDFCPLSCDICGNLIKMKANFFLWNWIMNTKSPNWNIIFDFVGVIVKLCLSSLRCLLHAICFFSFPIGNLELTTFSKYEHPFQ